MKETPEQAIARLRAEGSTGTFVVHFINGRPRDCEFNHRWKVPPDDEKTVDLTEARGTG